MSDEYKPYVPKAFTDTCSLMQQLAGMANMDYSGLRRMVLVLDVDTVPMLYVESFLDRNRMEDEQLDKIELKIIEGRIEITDSRSR